MIYPFMVVHNANSGNWKLNVIIPLVMSVVCLVLAIIAPFAYDDQKKASEGKKDKSDNAVQAAMLVKPNKFIVFLVMFYAFLCMAIMYGAQQYTKAFGLSVCGLSEIQAAGMTSIYTIGSICAVLFWAFMMAKLKWNPLKVVLIDSICTAVALTGVLFIHQVAIIYIAIAMLGFFAAGGALQTGLAVVQLFNPGPKGRNTGIYYTFMGAASYLIPVVAAQLTKSSGEASAVYSLMIMLLVFAILAILSSLYLVAQHKKIFGKSAL
ncbi:Inner membrane transport protein ydiM [[Ruminococcus] torques]|nr:Inner membrane transport protein ydiM [[Ruminococcus] torques]